MPSFIISPRSPRSGRPSRPGIVHRLDKDTSGVMVVARTARAYESLLRQFKSREVGKTYLGLALRRITAPEGRIDWPIGRHTTDGQKISVRTRHPKPAETFFTVLRVFKEATFLEIKPVTGRTHQIRVHLAAAGHPIAGDALYGPKKRPKVPRLFLHAHRFRSSTRDGGEADVRLPAPARSRGRARALPTFRARRWSGRKPGKTEFPLEEIAKI